jgi:hypothetical protein
MRLSILYEEEGDKKADTDHIEDLLAKWIVAKLKPAIEAKLKDPSVDLNKALYEMWPRAERVIPRDVEGTEIPDDAVGRKINMRASDGSGVAHVDGRFTNIDLGLKTLNDATTPEEVKEAWRYFITDIRHETGHIWDKNQHDEYNPDDDDTQEQKIQKAIDYLSDPAEMRAHARQLAMLYIDHIGEDLDEDKLVALAEKLKDKGHVKFYNYLVGVRKPKYDNVEHIDALRKFPLLVKHYFEKLNRQT